jgi:hypothetical protein
VRALRLAEDTGFVISLPHEAVAPVRPSHAILADLPWIEGVTAGENDISVADVPMESNRPSHEEKRQRHCGRQSLARPRIETRTKANGILNGKDGWRSKARGSQPLR